MIRVAVSPARPAISLWASFRIISSTRLDSSRKAGDEFARWVTGSTVQSFMASPPDKQSPPVHTSDTLLSSLPPTSTSSGSGGRGRGGSGSFGSPVLRVGRSWRPLNRGILASLPGAALITHVATEARGPRVASLTTSRACQLRILHTSLAGTRRKYSRCASRTPPALIWRRSSSRSARSSGVSLT